jgi:hypothetical protein
MSSINIPFKLHKAQREIFNCPKRFRVTVNGRRFGKTALGVTELIVRGLGYPHQVNPKFPVFVLGILPTANQARTVIWKPLVNICETPEFRPLIKEINRTSMEIILINNVIIRVAGANDNGGDRLRGLKIYFAWFDEMQDVKAIAFDEVVRPAMSDTVGSRALFTGTPKGKNNVLYFLSQKPTSDPDWEYFSYPTWENPLIPKEEIDRARATLPPRLFSQEYEANFVDFPGKWYTELDNDNKFYGALPKFQSVFMGIDFGDLHPAAVVIGRGTDRKYYVVEGWSPNPGREAKPIPDPVLQANISRLVKKWNVQYTYCDPSRASSILSIRSLGQEPGFRNAVAGYNRILEGIHQVHGHITRKDLLFVPSMNDKVADSLDGIECFQLLEAYHRLQDKSGAFNDIPADGYFSHINDALRYALATKVG